MITPVNISSAELREKMRMAIGDALFSLGRPELADLIEYGDIDILPEPLDKAGLELYAYFQEGFKRLSRLDSRLQKMKIKENE